MGTYSSGTFYSDLIVNEKEDITDDLLALIPYETPFLNSIGWPGDTRAESLTHGYQDDAFVPKRTTLNGTITAGATTVVLTEAIAEPGSRIVVEGEVIGLGTSSDKLTFNNCDRSLGTIAASSHTSGVNVLDIGKPQVQGAPAGDASSVSEPRAVWNYVQEFERVIEVPTAANIAKRYGRPGLVYDEKVEQNMRDIKLEAEWTAMFGVAQAPVPSSGTAGAMDGVVERVIGTNTSSLGDANFTLADLQDAVDAIADYYDPGEQLMSWLIVPFYQHRVFNGWQQAHVEVAPSDPFVQTYGVHVRRLQINSMMINVVPNQRIGNVSLLYQPKYIRSMPYLDFTHEKLANDGRRMRGMVTGAFTTECYCPEAHWVFQDVKVA